MINFFRKTRKKLADDNKPLKYARYAVGEIVLVVIGILIALSINNWNEWRKERFTENKVLENLKENLEMNIHQIESQLTAIHRNNQSGEIILSVLGAVQVNTDTLGHHFHRALLNNGNLRLSQAGYESLKNVGFEIIQNEYLQNDIVDLYEITYLNLNRVQQWGMEVRPDWDSFVVEHFILGISNWVPRDFNFVINNHYFNGLVAVGRAQRRYYGEKYQKALKETIRVLQLIKDELGEEGVKE